MINIAIPTVLGDIVNVISRYSAHEGGDFINDVREPVLKLIAMYSLQVHTSTISSSMGEYRATYDQ